MELIHNTATVTSKGQITLPKFVRQALGIEVGSKLNFSLQNDNILISMVDEPEHSDPAITKFLSLLEQDISQGQYLARLPESLVSDMKGSVSKANVEAVEIEGEVCL